MTNRPTPSIDAAAAERLAANPKTILREIGKHVQDLAASFAPEALVDPVGYIGARGWVPVAYTVHRRPVVFWIDPAPRGERERLGRAVKVQIMRESVAFLMERGWTVTSGSFRCECPSDTKCPASPCPTHFTTSADALRDPAEGPLYQSYYVSWQAAMRRQMAREVTT